MVYYAFLRAVNVGPSTKVDMPLLKRHLKETYNISVETYKNSGNIIVKDPNDQDKVLKNIEESVKNLFKIDIAALGRDKDQLNHSLEKNPFARSEFEKSKTILYIVEKEILADRILEFGKMKGIEEEYWYAEKILYVHYKNGVGRSKLTTAAIERGLESRVTGRNVNTIEEVVSKW